MDAITLVGLRETPLSIDEVVSAVGDPRAGGTAFFVGTVRDHDHGRDVVRLSYSAHPSAESEMRRVMEKVVADTAGHSRPVCRVAALHRVGELRIGDTAVVVAAAAGHRDEAFAACRRLIDDIKAEVPIWKHQEFSDGGAEWVGAE
ncbi:molybdenum cofactor biosynthesis protein MoaE [Streptomonospora sp. S1-112]|uniref:Molybdopterin synthase catalytic subunit 1 n=2 Tax=Streptomonospora TaxID=104204 RepID=A0A853BTU9_9ACTN|nr:MULTISPECIES: molybdenum cofactor biosynthesis protein MoaE [Streptomonospora]MBV2362714.1 molybdenum cofactor biosynthesis protein MoaE [Streptomonospora nanhaiensis]MBX9391692.1 molybdenum cofactor biosynthesis protein MoaE [Streptomonospora nanhaiensis]MDA0562960.1 molybdenum cofactor biosynthesis protein MoaE [Streptomonospora mangrovi]NYI97937.1 molybdopterin synthase catalytic subunit [Streptomonospora nanhaiensis]